jgi:hypothetical protein
MRGNMYMQRNRSVLYGYAYASDPPSSHRTDHQAIYGRIQPAVIGQTQQTIIEGLDGARSPTTSFKQKSNIHQTYLVVTLMGPYSLTSSKESAKGLDEVPCTNDTMLLVSRDHGDAQYPSLIARSRFHLTATVLRCIIASCSRTYLMASARLPSIVISCASP